MDITVDSMQVYKMIRSVFFMIPFESIPPPFTYIDLFVHETNFEVLHKGVLVEGIQHGEVGVPNFVLQQ